MSPFFSPRRFGRADGVRPVVGRKAGLKVQCNLFKTTSRVWHSLTTPYVGESCGLITRTALPCLRLGKTMAHGT